MSHSNGARGGEPCDRVYQALEAADCNPTGPVYKFTAKCPAHEDRSPSLAVVEGVDRRCVLHCHAGCEPHAVIRALGLDWSDLFPDGHRSAGRRAPKPRPVETDDPLIAILAALGSLGIEWRATVSPAMYVVAMCPACGDTCPGAMWVTRGEISMTPRKKAAVSCINGCTADDVLGAIEQRMTAHTSAEARLGRGA